MKSFSMLIFLLSLASCVHKSPNPPFKKNDIFNLVQKEEFKQENFHPEVVTNYESPVYFIVSLLFFCLLVLPCIFYFLNKRRSKFYIK